MILRTAFTFAFLFLLTPMPAAVAQTLDPAGIWLTEKGDAKVRVTRCGSGVCGVVIWLREPIDPATGKPQIDDKNQNPQLAKRPIIGINLFNGMRPSGANRWSGRIYNADDGRFYDSNVSVTAPNALRVEGCVGAFCGGETWTRTKR